MTECAACWAAIRTVRATGQRTTCDACGLVYAPSDGAHAAPAAPLHDPEREHRARGPVDPRAGLLALALELPRMTGGAIPIEPERRAPDAEERAESYLRAAQDPMRRDLRRERRTTLALRALSRAHELVDAGHGEAVAQLWAFWGVVPLAVDSAGVPDYGPADLARRLDALALGCAPRLAREEWRALAAQHRTAHDLSRRLPRRTDADGREVGCAPRVVHTITTGQDPVPVTVSAAVWGRELLAPLWPQARRPPQDLSAALALGWATPRLRGGWEAIGTRVIRDAERRAWAQAQHDAAAAVWRGRDD